MNKNISQKEIKMINLLKEYENIKIFKMEQLEFKIKFIKIAFGVSGKNINYDARTTLFLNAVLQDMKIPYEISTRFDPNKKRDSTFWVIIESQE